MEEDVIMDESGAIPSIQFSDKVHDQVDHNMCNAIIIHLLGRTIGYKTLEARIHARWNRSSLRGLRQYVCYLTMQPWSRSFTALEKHHSHVIVWIRLMGLPYQYYTKVIFQYITSFIGRVVKIDYNTDAGER
ncbi:hypothetical protein GQ457_05G014610 [Hibiscus cannabinus]